MFKANLYDLVACMYFRSFLVLHRRNFPSCQPFPGQKKQNSETRRRSNFSNMIIPINSSWFA